MDSTVCKFIFKYYK